MWGEIETPAPQTSNINGTSTSTASKADDWHTQMVEAIADNAGITLDPQRPEMSRDERIKTADKIWTEVGGGQFVCKFGAHFTPSQLTRFTLLSAGDREVSSALLHISRSSSSRRRRVKNRRLAAWRRMEAASDAYVGEEAMRDRDPLAYEQMVGRFMTEEEKRERDAALTDSTNCSLTNIILEHVDLNRRRDRLKEQEAGEKVEENDSEEEESEEGGETDSKEGLRAEFLDHMLQSFLGGKDSDHFDYSKVDEDEDLDDCEESERDREEKYFDKD